MGSTCLMKWLSFNNKKKKKSHEMAGILYNSSTAHYSFTITSEKVLKSGCTQRTLWKSKYHTFSPNIILELKSLLLKQNRYFSEVASSLSSINRGWLWSLKAWILKSIQISFKWNYHKSPKLFTNKQAPTLSLYLDHNLLSLFI